MRLVPHSGVQFVTLTVRRPAGPLVATAFARHSWPSRSGETQTTLVPCGPSAGGGPAAHPVTGDPLQPEETVAITDREAMRAFAGRWIPLPFFRYLGADSGGRAKYDSGPSNWVRCFLSDSGNAAESRLVLALDTHLAQSGRFETEDYLAPCIDDSRFGSFFAFAVEFDDLAPFLSEAWLARWLEEAYVPGPGTANGDDARTLAAATYLTLLRVLQAGTSMPAFSFNDTTIRQHPVPVHAVDLILNIGDATTSAVLVEDGSAVAGAIHGAIEPVHFRDLSDPTLVHQGPIQTRVEFDAMPFGAPGLSRLSGRTDAFRWPSVVRIGHEAQRLSLRANSCDGQTGLAMVDTYLLDHTPSIGSWRLSTDDARGRRAGPVVAADFLLDIGHDGRLIEDHSKSVANDVRPRFSRSTMTGLFATELALHALSQINSPQRAGDTGAPAKVRELRNIVVALEVAAPPAERQQLLDQIDNGIGLLWQALGWNHGRQVGMPPKPSVVGSIGGTLGAQIVVLKEEVDRRFGGDFVAFLQTLTGSHGRWPIARKLRLASVNLGMNRTSVAIVEYVVNGREPVETSIKAMESIPAGGDRILEGLAIDHVLPAIERALAASGLRRARAFVDETFGAGASLYSAAEPQFRSRFVHRVVLPAARSLLELYRDGSRGCWSGNRTEMLDALVERSNGRLAPLDRQLAQLAEADGARGFRLGGVRVPLVAREIGRTLRQSYGGVVQDVVDLVVHNEIDLLYVFGELAGQADIADMLVDALPIAASRIISAGDRDYRSLAPFAGTDGRHRDDQHAVALLASCLTLAADRAALPAATYGLLESAGTILRTDGGEYPAPAAVQRSGTG